MRVLWAGGKNRQLRWGEAGKGLGTPCYGVALRKDLAAWHLFSPPMHYVNADLLLFGVYGLLVFIVVAKKKKKIKKSKPATLKSPPPPSGKKKKKSPQNYSRRFISEALPGGSALRRDGDNEPRCLVCRQDRAGAACSSPGCGQGASAEHGIAIKNKNHHRKKKKTPRNKPPKFPV